MALDYQLNSDKLLIGQFEDFYPNSIISEINGALLPKISEEYNKKFRIFDLKFGYNRFEQDRAEQNTLDLIHSYSEMEKPCTR